MTLLNPNKKNQTFKDVTDSIAVLADDALWRSLAKLLSRRYNTAADEALGTEADLLAALQLGIDLINVEFRETVNTTRRLAAKESFDTLVKTHGRDIVADLLIDEAEIDGRLSSEHVIYRKAV